jgi:2-keto-3-deoxy-L-fuconate dehydrogenase
MFSLKNKIVVVTGGASGIGKAISILFAQRGAILNIVDRDEASAERTCSEIKDLGGVASVNLIDVSKQSEVIRIFEKIGPIDILVNNAGVAHIGTAENTVEADFDRIYSVNVKGVYNCLHAAIPAMKIKGGVILNMASVAALVGIGDRFAYSMSKGAISAMTLSVARDFMNDRIRCNSISPARVHTPFVDGFIAKNYPGREEEIFEKLSKAQPIGRMAKSEEVASLALYLCSDEAEFISGCDYPLDGGFVKLNN